MISKFLKSSKVYFSFAICLSMLLVLSACNKPNEVSDSVVKEEVNLFVAASLTSSIEEVVRTFTEENPNIKVIVNADSSGKLSTQISEGFDCDIFFSASTREVDELIELGLINAEDTSKILENNLAIIGFKEQEYSIKNLADIKSVDSIALAYGSVPVGFYARKALIAQKILKGDYPDKAAIKELTGSEVAEVLGGVTISEQANASTTVTAVAEKSTDIGFAYTSDVNRNKNTKVVLKISKDLTGEIVYPIAKVKLGEKSTDEHIASVQKLFDYLQSNTAKEVYQKYGFSPL